MLDMPARARPWPLPWPVAACALLFFLGSADQFFAVRVSGITLRVAQLVLLAGLIAWWRSKPSDLPDETRKLLIAWGPFFCLYLVASTFSADPLPGLLRLAWFAFNFVAAYAWCRLFVRTDLVLGYFSAYLVIAAVILFDFLIGFGAGPAQMIAYAQATYGVPGREGWFRPHAFYYEPSYAAAALSLAWALALTPLYVHAPKTSAAMAIAGFAALAVTFSRTGWIYQLVALVAIVVIGGTGLVASLRRRALYLVAGGLWALTIVVMLIPEQNRGGVATLLQALGVSATAERICPIVDDWFPSWDLQCLQGEERAHALPFNQPGELPQSTSEGARLWAWENTLERIKAHPFAGEGVMRGKDRLIEPTVPNTWLEITVEGGVFALIAFAWGLGATLYQWGGLRRENRAVGIVLLLYFLVSWQFIQTFPRLDQWLSLWMALMALRAEPRNAGRFT